MSIVLEVQPAGPVAALGQFVTDTPSELNRPVGVKMTARSARCVVPAEATSMSSSPSPAATRPLPFSGGVLSIAPKYDGTEPAAPVHMLTCSGIHDRPPTAMWPSL